MDLAGEFLAFLQREGVYAINPLLVAIIAIVAVLVIRSWGMLLLIAIVAAAAHVAAEVLVPMVMNGAAMRALPVLEFSFWHGLLVLYVVYVVVIGVAFFVKSTVLRS